MRNSELPAPRSSTEPTSGWGLPAHLEVLTAGLLANLALLALVRMPRARLRAGGALVGIGAVLVLHLIGIVVHIAYFDGVRVLRWGGARRIAGGLLLVIAGARVARAESAAEAPTAPT